MDAASNAESSGGKERLMSRDHHKILKIGACFVIGVQRRLACAPAVPRGRGFPP